MAHELTTYQKAILAVVDSWLTDPNSPIQNLLIDAKAGSGKTFLLVEAGKKLRENAIYLAFNKKIEREAQEKFKGSGTTVRTTYGQGYRIVSDNCEPVMKAAEPQENKYFEIIKELVNDNPEIERGDKWTMRQKLLKLVNLTRLTLTDPADKEAMGQLCWEHNIDLEEFGLIPNIFQKGEDIMMHDGIIDFADMVYMPVRMNWYPKNPLMYVLGDESQDWNKSQLEIVMRTRAKDGHFLNVGDPFQAIYLFAGADANAFENVRKRTNATVMKLPHTFRSGRKIVDLAAPLAPGILAQPNAHEGEVINAPAEDLPKYLNPGTMILSRKRKPLIKLYFELVTNYPVVLVGADIGKMLLNLLDAITTQAQGGFVIKDLPYHVERYKKIQLEKLPEDQEAKRQEVHDKCDVLIMIFEKVEAADEKELADKIKKMFIEPKKRKSDDVISLSTVHMAKGLEADTVVLLDPGNLPLKWEKQTEDEREQEYNCLYIAITRAINRLVLLGGLHVPTRSLLLPSDFQESSTDAAAEQEQVVIPFPAPEIKPEPALDFTQFNEATKPVVTPLSPHQDRRFLSGPLKRAIRETPKIVHIVPEPITRENVLDKFEAHLWTKPDTGEIILRMDGELHQIVTLMREMLKEMTLA